MALFMDIETFREDSDAGYIAWKSAGISAPSNYKDPIKIEEYIAGQKKEMLDKFALSPLTGKIILIGLLTDKKLMDDFGEPTHAYKDKPHWLFQLALDPTKPFAAGNSEIDILKQFWKIFNAFQFNDGSHFVTFNGKQFDLPFILHRTAINNIVLPDKIKMSKYLNKYNNDNHLDLYNWFGAGSLVEWSYRLGISPSLERDGNKIGGWYEAGQIDTIKQKNSIDLFQTAEIYQRIKDWI